MPARPKKHRDMGREYHYNIYYLMILMLYFHIISQTNNQTYNLLKHNLILVELS